MKLKILLLLFLLAAAKDISAQDRKEKNATIKTPPVQEVTPSNQPKTQLADTIKMIYKADASFFQEAPKPFQDGAKYVDPSTIIFITNNEKDANLRFFNMPDSVCKINPARCDSLEKKIAKGKSITISNAEIKTLIDTSKTEDQKIFFKDIADPKKWGVISLIYGNSPDPKSAIPCEPINNKYFVIDIPSSIKAKYRSGLCFDCDQKNDYVINYDLSTGPPVLSFYKRKQAYVKCDQNPVSISNEISICSCNSLSCGHIKHIPRNGYKKVYYYKQKTKIMPSVGKNIGFRIYGYWPDFDSLGFQTSYVSRNLEQRDAFSKLITPPTNSTKNVDSTNTKSGAEAIHGITESATSRYITILKNELKDYLDQLVYMYKSKAEVGWTVETINDRFYVCFKTKISGPDDIEKWGDSLIMANKNNLTGQESSTLRGDLLAAVRYYKKLLAYNPDMTIPVVQVENEDMLIYDIKYYSSGKVKYDTPYSLLISGGLKIDFSTGITATGLVDKEYTTVPIDTNSLKILEKSGGKNINLGLSLISHIYARAGRRVNLGFGVGFMLDANASVNKYLVGGSLMLGHEQRFIFNYGLAIGKVKTLADGFDVGKSYLTSSNQNLQTQIPTKDVWDTGWFFGLSYNLGGTTLSKK